MSMILGDCLEVMPTLDANSIDSIVTDPPYGLSFMGKDWDHGVPGEHFWKEALRVAKPGAFLLAFGGSRTFHRLASAIEDAGWELRDTIMWVYGSGFPKSHDISKAIDKAAGVSFTASPASGVGFMNAEGAGGYNTTKNRLTRVGEGVGWGTALKPAFEPIIMARKPFKGTVAENFLVHGVGGLNIDGCRVGFDGGCAGAGAGAAVNCFGGGLNGTFAQPVPGLGRWPANLIHDGSHEVLALFPTTTSGKMAAGTKRKNKAGWAGDMPETTGAETLGDSGSAARFFYCAKASSKDRHEGLPSPGTQFKHGDTLRKIENTDTKGNDHPTVKPTDLMRYLCRLVTPPGGTILDPFAGSGSTGKAAVLEGFEFVGIERETNYLEIANARIAAVTPVPDWLQAKAAA